MSVNNQQRQRRQRTLSTPTVGSLRVKTLKESQQQECIVREGVIKEVGFSHLEVREYPIILGDNPSCADGGPPLTIDWDYDPNTHFSMDLRVFERMRQRDRRQNPNDLMIPKKIRTDWLSKSGVEQREIASAVRDARRVKHSRMVSSQQTNLDPVHEHLETFRGGVKRLLKFRKSKYEKQLEFHTKVGGGGGNHFTNNINDFTNTISVPRHQGRFPASA